MSTAWQHQRPNSIPMTTSKELIHGKKDGPPPLLQWLKHCDIMYSLFNIVILQTELLKITSILY